MSSSSHNGPRSIECSYTKRSQKYRVSSSTSHKRAEKYRLSNSLSYERPEKYRMSSSPLQVKARKATNVLTLTLHPHVLVVATVRLTLKGVPAWRQISLVSDTHEVIEQDWAPPGSIVRLLADFNIVSKIRPFFMFSLQYWRLLDFLQYLFFLHVLLYKIYIL